jgi:tartrate dehydrogenase/decarboxylase/D-malate dehydrogenase
LTHRIALIPGDGIGLEVVPQAVRVLEAVGAQYDISFEWQPQPWGCAYYRETGRMMPANAVDRLRECDAILLGAVGWPGIPDHVSLWGLLLPIRRGLQQYINLRPVRVLRGLRSPLRDRDPEHIDMVIIRENNEGEYSEIGGRLYQGTDREMVLQASIFTRHGTDRVMRFAFELARRRPDRHLTSATKSNGIMHSMPFWDERFAAIASEYQDVRADQYHVDALAAQLVLRPERFDVIVGSNLFGDILSDLAPALAGSLAIAPSANLNPEREFPSMFEPVHGSAPDIAGKGIANPIGQIWSAALMLEQLGHPEAARAIERAIETAIADKGIRTPDLGGTASTEQMGEAIASAVSRAPRARAAAT